MESYGKVININKAEWKWNLLLDKLDKPFPRSEQFDVIYINVSTRSAGYVETVYLTTSSEIGSTGDTPC